MIWRKYQHVARLDHEEVEGILDMPNIYLEPKLDGANASIFMEDGIVKAAKRSCILGKDQEFRGLVGWLYENQGRFTNFFNCYSNTIIYGEWLCLSGDTLVRKTSGGRGGRGNYMTLREMYQYATQGTEELSSSTDKKGQRYKIKRQKSWWKRYGYPSLFSLDIKKDRIIPNKMVKIKYTGDKKVYKITTRNDFSIKSTLEHKFLTNNGWKKLKDISEEDCVATSKLVSSRRPHRRLGKGSRAITKLWKELRNSNPCFECGICNSRQIHHIDGNYLNNNLENLRVLCSECHNKKHPDNVSFSKVSFNYQFDKIISIKYVGVEDCYDIEMKGLENNANFVADGFIVHNCKHAVSWYIKEAWNKFYAYDILNCETNKLLSPDVKKKMFAEFDIMFIPSYKLSDEEKNIDCLNAHTEDNKYLCEGDESGEGIVIKAFDENGDPFVNKYGRTQWAKIVRPKFKENAKMKKKLQFEGDLEEHFAELFVTSGRVEKMKQKIMTIRDTGWRSEYIGQLMGMIYHDVFEEELWGFVKRNKVKALDFKMLQHCVVTTVRKLVGL